MARECRGEVYSLLRKGGLFLWMALGGCIFLGCGPEGEEMNDSKGSTGESSKASRLIKGGEQDGLVFYAFHFKGGDGKEVTARAAFPASRGERPCVMIYFHRAAEDTGVVNDLGPMAARSGWGVVAMPYPGRPERPCEEGDDTRALALADAHACVEALETLPEFETEPLLTACGASLGAPTAIRLAADAEAVKGVLAISTGAQPAMGDLDPARHAKRIAPHPFFLIGAEQDQIFSQDSIHALFDAAREPKELIWVKAPHLFPIGEIEKPVREFLSSL